MSAPTPSSDWIGKSNRVCRVVKATIVPIEIEWPTKLCPASQ